MSCFALEILTLIGFSFMLGMLTGMWLDIRRGIK